MQCGAELMWEGTAMAGRRELKKALNRQKLIDATIDSIIEHGLSGTTVSTVVTRTGLSRGIVNLQFDSKEALLEATLRYLTEEWHLRWQAALEAAEPTPAARLRSSLIVMFEPGLANQRRLAVWPVFWADSHYREMYARVCGKADGDYRRALRRYCQALVDDETTNSGQFATEPDLIADALATLVNGLWMDILTIPKVISRSRARQICELNLTQWFPKHFAAPGPGDKPVA